VTLTGQVRGDGLATARNRPQVQLMITPKSPEAAVMPMEPAAVRSDFGFTLTAPAAEVGIRAVVNSQEWVVKAIRVGGIDVTDTGINLRGAHDVRDVEVELTSRPPEVTVNVTGNQGEAPERYELLIFPDDRNRWLFDSRLVVRRSAATRSTAPMTIRTLPPGRYLAAALEYIQPETAQDPDFLESLRGRATPFSVGEGSGALVDLRVISAERKF
jgi:hypothetical protein